MQANQTKKDQFIGFKISGSAKILLPILFVIVLISVLSLSACGEKTVNPVVNVRVTISKVKIISATIYLKEPGYFLPYKTASIASRSAGQIVEIIARDGDFVKAGQVLAVIDRKKAYFAMELQKDILARDKAAYALTKSTLKRDAILFKKRLLTALNYDRAVSIVRQAKGSYNAALSLLNIDRKNYEDTLITTLISGIVYKRRINLGDYVVPGELSYNIVALRPLEFKFYIPQSYIPFINKGEACFVTIKGYPRKVFSGNIYFISPSLNPQTRMVEIKALFLNSRERIRPQYFGRVKFSIGFVRNGFFVPEPSVVITLKGDYLFVYKNGVVKRRAVSVGINKDGYLQITKGISKNDIVVVRGSNLVHDNEHVVIVKRAI